MSYNSTAQLLTWNIMETNSTAPTHIITPVITGCNLSLSGGRCFKWTKNLILSRTQCDYVFWPEHDIELESGANYTIQLRAMNEVTTSNFSVHYQFTTSSFGEYRWE
jgi:hypothetical protein